MGLVKFDPRVKMILFLISCFFSIYVNETLYLIMFASFIMLLMLLAGKVKNAISLYIIFIVSVAITKYSFVIGEHWTLSVIVAVFMLVRMCVPVVMAFSLLFQTTKISEFMSAFEKMHCPYVVVIPFVVMFRFFPTVKEEWIGIRQAMSFRGIGLGIKGFICHPIRFAEYILVPLLFSCVNIMDELVAASLARGLDTEKKRTCYFNVKMKIYDYFIVAVTLAFSVLIFI